jgi:transposase
VQQATGDAVEPIYVDRGYAGEWPAQASRAERIELCVAKLDNAKKGFVLLPRRWVVERSFAWMTRVAFACFMLRRAVELMQRA